MPKSRYTARLPVMYLNGASSVDALVTLKAVLDVRRRGASSKPGTITKRCRTVPPPRTVAASTQSRSAERMNIPDDGYAIAEQVVGSQDLDSISQALAAAGLPRTRAGTRHILQVARVRALAEDPALVCLAGAFIGEQPLPFRATLFDKSATSNWLVPWHQDTALPLRRRIDTPSWGPWSVKGGVLHGIAPAVALARIIALRVHLDDSSEANGPLRVLPGSHTDGVLSQEQIQRISASVTSVSCIAAAGGVVAMRPLLVHASSKATDDRPRRVIHIEYAASVDVGDGLQLAVG